MGKFDDKLLDDYYEWVKVYREEYSNAVVLCRCGKFYEIYGDDEGYMNKLSLVLDMKKSRKNNGIEVSRKNPYCIGFPFYVLDKYLPMLLDANYTVIKVDEIGMKANGSKERKVTSIYLPTMNLDNLEIVTNYTMGVYVEFIRETIVISIAILDLSTGHVEVYQHTSLESLTQTISNTIPREILYYTKDKDIDKLHSMILEEGLDNEGRRKIKKMELKKYGKTENQEEILERVYNKRKNKGLSPIEYIALERYDGIVTVLCAIIDYIYSHNSDIIRMLKKPVFNRSEKYMYLNDDTLYDFNILSRDPNVKPLLNILDTTSTNMGKRLFRKRFLQPITDQNKLQKRYDIIEAFIADNKYEELSKCTSHGRIKDISKLHHFIEIERFNTNHFYHLYISYSYIDILFERFTEYRYIKKSKKVINEFSKFYKEFTYYFDNNNSEYLFTKDVFPKYTALCEEYKGLKSELYDIAEEISSSIPSKGNNNRGKAVKIEDKGVEGIKLFCTAAKHRELKKIHKKDLVFVKETKDRYTISNEKIDSIVSEIVERKIEINRKKLHLYSKVLRYLRDTYPKVIRHLPKVIAKIDVAVCCARTAKENVYSKPILIDSTTSSLDFKGIRNPLLERIFEDVEYIRNDIAFTLRGNEGKGILLFGPNISGKSSLLKAVGMNVIMAQTGMYVAATAMTFSPYNALLTKILLKDNIYKGKSAFENELLELRSILNNATERSLVLADELCAGTETLSAVTIVSSVIEELAEKNCSFLFATHLHELYQLNDDWHKDKIRLMHLEIIENEEGKIIYTHKLVTGHGSSYYGLKIAEAYLPPEFIKRCKRNMKHITKENDSIISSRVVSKYNKKLRLNICVICGKENKKGEEFHTHHIRYQSEADENGMIDHFHKNKKHNISSLCESCHRKVHNGKLKIKGYIRTSEGIKLEYSHM